jgi:hypothetical protein
MKRILTATFLSNGQTITVFPKYCLLYPLNSSWLLPGYTPRKGYLPSTNWIALYVLHFILTGPGERSLSSSSTDEEVWVSPCLLSSIYVIDMLWRHADGIKFSDPLRCQIDFMKSKKIKRYRKLPRLNQVSEVVPKILRQYFSLLTGAFHRDHKAVFGTNVKFYGFAFRWSHGFTGEFVAVEMVPRWFQS